ncbi:MAG: helix-turn-helix domain-containing protein, partial [Acidimicrobiia bacterium]
MTKVTPNAAVRISRTRHLRLRAEPASSALSIRDLNGGTGNPDPGTPTSVSTTDLDWYFCRSSSKPHHVVRPSRCIYAPWVSASTIVSESRRSAGLSRAELARRAGVPRSTVMRIEDGVVDPTIGMLTRLLGASQASLE